MISYDVPSWWKKTLQPNPFNSLAAIKPKSSLLQARIVVTLHGGELNIWAISLPIPLFDPVTRAIVFCMVASTLGTQARKMNTKRPPDHIQLPLSSALRQVIQLPKEVQCPLCSS